MRTATKHIHICIALALSLAGSAFVTCAAGSEGPGFSFGSSEGKNGNCFDCHGSAENVGEKNFIDPVKYGHTNHARIGCPACHDTVARAAPRQGADLRQGRLHGLP